MIAAVNIVLCLYSGLIHQRGVMDLMDVLRHENELSVYFAMPCHSTPWLSHMHTRGQIAAPRMRYITCEPPLESQQKHFDESDLFYANVSTHMSRILRKQEYTHLVMFKALL